MDWGAAADRWRGVASLIGRALCDEYFLGEGTSLREMVAFSGEFLCVTS